MTLNSHKVAMKDLSSSLYKSIEKISKEEGYVQCDFEVRNLDTVGSNCLGDLVEIDIKGKTATVEKETNLFVKKKINLDKTPMLRADELYGLEVFVYNELSEIFARLQDEAGVPQNDRFKLAKSYSETNTDAIILENLCKKGFKTYEKLEVVPLKFVQLSVMELARFHGLSFVIEDKMPKFHQNKIKVLEHPLHFDEDWNNFMRKVVAYVANLCDDETKAKIEDFLPTLLEKTRIYNSDKTTTKCALTHNNFKSANVLYRDHDGDPLEVIIVDYQFIDYGCPMRDFYFAVLSNTDHVIRRNHLNDLKDLYFKTLSRFLKYFDMDVETVYPRKEFENVYLEWLDYGLMKMFLALPFLFPTDAGIDFESTELNNIPIRLEKNLQDRVRELMQDYVDWGVL